MKLKRNSLVVLCVGFAALLVGAVQHFTGEEPLFTALRNQISLCLIAWGITLIISAAFCLIFPKTVRSCLSVGTSAIAIGVPAVAAFGFFYSSWWFAIFLFIAGPNNTVLALFLGALRYLILPLITVLIMIYIKLRRKKWSAQGLIIDILTAVVYFPALYLLFAGLYLTVSTLQI